MAATSVLGYNIVVRMLSGSDTKTFVGVTANSLEISPEMKESITKDDLGQKKKTLIGNNITFSIEALSMLKETGDTLLLDRNDIIDLTLAGSEFDFIYGPFASGSKVRKGKAKITSFSESSPADGDATISVSCEVQGALTTETLPLS